MLSLGAGVQSTTLALMAANGELGPMPELCDIADTGWEPKAVYDHLAWLRSPNVLPFPVHIVSAGICALTYSPAHRASDGPRSPPSPAP